MPQLDQFTYFTQFFWLCLFFFTFYIFICNDGDGVLGISRILKLRNQLLSHRGKNIRSKDPNRLEDIDILRKGFSTGRNYMYYSLVKVYFQQGKLSYNVKKKFIVYMQRLISSFGEISGSRGMERNIFYFISKSSYSTSSNPGWGKTCRNDIMLIHVLHGQGSMIYCWQKPTKDESHLGIENPLSFSFDLCYDLSFMDVDKILPFSSTLGDGIALN